MRRLILIEGMIGAGKSTTAGRLAAMLTQAGADTRAFLELADDHPIRTRATDVLRGDAAGPQRLYDRSQWSALAEQCRCGSGSVILESTFLQNSVMPLFIDGAPIAAVKDVFADIVRRLAVAAPLLMYLRPSDIAGAVRRVHAERGEPWSARNYAFVSACEWARRRGLSGHGAVVELYRAWEAVVDELLPAMDFVRITDPQTNWDGTLRQLYDAARLI